MSEAIWITFAFTLGLLVKGVGLPPLLSWSSSTRRTSHPRRT